MSTDAPDPDDDTFELEALEELDLPDIVDDPLFDAGVAEAMRVDNDEDERRQAMFRLGQRMGAMWQGMTNMGMPSEEAAEIVNDWMRSAVFDEIPRQTGTQGT